VNRGLASRWKRLYTFGSRHVFGLAVVALVLLAGPCPVAVSQGAGQDDATVKDFESRVAKYLELRKKEAGSAPRPTNSPEKIVESQEDLATKVKALRMDAKQGDIFTPEIAEYFRRQISATLAGDSGHKIRASLRHAEPVHALSLQVNQTYPQGIPLQSTPPTLLMNLPRLPKELEYRIVGHNLVLHDIAPNIVVDFISDAIPSNKD
jgi:hypothetical protein